MTHKIFTTNDKVWFGDVRFSSQKSWWFQTNLHNSSRSQIRNIHLSLMKGDMPHALAYHLSSSTIMQANCEIKVNVWGNSKFVEKQYSLKKFSTDFATDTTNSTCVSEWQVEMRCTCAFYKTNISAKSASTSRKKVNWWNVAWRMVKSHKTWCVKYNLNS